ncbi:uncharacterized protein LOC135471118 [Liolophura sinensis]|uniref:uncharacterized protein LOC135471118 n=1 Tax=Liolophura sinensis TaxID=3198878 RepID=UPI0031591DEF
MTHALSREFVETKISKLSTTPQDWDVDKSQYFKLDLKMCHLRSVVYGFVWGSDSSRSDRFKDVVEMPSRVCVLDLSLNELSSLEYDSLAPLSNLRALDASLNRISSVTGIEQLKHLHTLNLSHNEITRIDLMPSCPSLVELNLSMNKLEDITGLPRLVNLKVLHFNNNQLKSLDGVQSLGRLHELYIQNNKVPDLIPLCGCLHLSTLNAANNRILTLHSVTDVLGRLKKLRILNLEGNPIDRSPNYHSELLQKTNVVSLDNVPIRPTSTERASTQQDNLHLTDNILSIRDMTKKVYEEHLKCERSKMEENIHFLQGRIVSLQDNFQEFEKKLRSDLDLCLMHLEGLSSSQLARFDANNVQVLLKTPEAKPWQQVNDWEMKSSQKTKHESKTDYKKVRDTDQLLRLAYMELSRDLS